MYINSKLSISKKNSRYVKVFSNIFFLQSSSTLENPKWRQHKFADISKVSALYLIDPWNKLFSFWFEGIKGLIDLRMWFRHTYVRGKWASRQNTLKTWIFVSSMLDLSFVIFLMHWISFTLVYLCSCLSTDFPFHKGIV